MNATSASIGKFLSAALFAVMLVNSLHAAGSVTTYRSGINVNILGIAGEDYVVEDLYYDRPVADHRVTYIKAATQIAMEHNVNNIAGKTTGQYAYAPADINQGTIKIKPDGDGRMGARPANWRTYDAPFSFSNLNYGMFGESGRSVVGSVGDNGLTRTHATKDSYLHYGVLDEAGEEWHTLTVADDDTGGGRHSSFAASDGKVHLFVVNPNSCISWAVTGDAKYHTSPPKHYFIPHIFAQETRFETGDSGTVRATIRSLYNENVFYRIVSDPGSLTPFTNAGADFVVLDDKSFVGNGEHYLQFYCGAANSAKTKTRKVLKNPAYPSASETHGDRLWINASNYTNAFKDATWWTNAWKTSNDKNNLDGFVNRRTGNRGSSGNTAVNAFLARRLGMTATRTGYSTSFAEYAKYALMESRLLLDPVGMELHQNLGEMPTRELSYRGYWDVNLAFDSAFAYDILVGYFRKNQGYANGITPVEDYFLRDMLARWVHLCGLWAGGHDNNATNNNGGMWDTARKTGAAFIAAMMPSYSTPYFGTSGMDGNAQVYNDTILPTLNHTWYDLFLDNNIPVTGYPRLNATMGVNETLWTSDGTWDDKIQYANLPMMGRCIGIYYNILKLFHPTKTLPRYDMAMAKAAAGTLRGTKLDAGQVHTDTFYAWAHLQNAWFPEFRNVAQPEMLSRTANADIERLGRQQEQGGIWVAMWYDHNLPLGKDPRSNADSTITPPSSPTDLRWLVDQ